MGWLHGPKSPWRVRLLSGGISSHGFVSRYNYLVVV